MVNVVKKKNRNNSFFFIFYHFLYIVFLYICNKYNTFYLKWQ